MSAISVIQTKIRLGIRNAVTTATQLRTNRFLDSSPYALQLSRSIMGEVVQVAKAKGLNVPEGTVDKLILQCTSVKEGLPSSMLYDYLAGRPMEVEVSFDPLYQDRRNNSLTMNYKGHSWYTAKGRDPVGSRITFSDGVSGVCSDLLNDGPMLIYVSTHAQSLYSIVKALDWKNLHPEEAKI
jgi:hypothetical protein